MKRSFVVSVRNSVLALSLLLFLSLSFSNTVTSRALGLPESDLTSIDQESTRILQAVQSALDMQPRTDMYHSIIKPHLATYQGDWAYADLVATDEAGLLLPNALPPALVQRVQGNWTVALPNTELYADWLKKFPDTLLNQPAKEYLKTFTPVSQSTTPSVVANYKLPWMIDQLASVGCVESNIKGGNCSTPSGIYHGYAAVDLHLSDSQIRAAKAGVVIFRKDSSNLPPCNSIACWDQANVVVIKHSDTEYSWYMHIAYNTIPAEIQEGKWVAQGSIIGTQGCNGYCTGLHLHFHLASSWGGVINNTDPIHRIPRWPSIDSFAHVNFDEITWDALNATTWNQPILSKNKPPAVILYENANYQGYALALYDSDLDLCDNSLDPALGAVNPCFSAPSWTDAASSIRVSPGYRAILHIHNQADADRWGDDASMSYSCNINIADFGGRTFPNGTPLDNNVSRVIIDKCGIGASFAKENLSFMSDDPCSPEPPPASQDQAFFVADVSIPDGAAVSPGQSLIKTWRLRNTGVTTWGSGYQLVFISGEQMNAPSAVDVPNTVTGGTVDISINLTAPASQGEHTGYWRLRNLQGTYFGPTIWVKINVSDGTGGGGAGEISLACLDCPAIVSPGYTFRPTIRARVNSGQLQGINLRGDHLLNTDGNLFGGHPLVAVTGNTIVNPGQTYDFTFYQDNPIRAPDTPGTYESKWRVWRGSNYAGQELTIRFEVRVGGGVNRAPNRPSLVSPTDWATFLSGSGINLQAQHNGDPDGDSITGYYFEVFTAGPIANSGWTSSHSWTPPSLGFENFQWRVKVRDQYNSESEWSEIRHFTVENNEPQIYSFYSMTCRSAWNQGEPEKICFCSDTNAGTQRLQVNTAPDGSENGEWIVLNEIGTPDYTCSSDNDRPPTWGHLSFDPGHYRVRLYARRDGGWAAAAHRDIFVDLTADRRPDTPIGTPSNVYLNSRTVHFDWVDTKRTSNYRLVVSISADLTNPLIDLTLPAGTSEYTHTFPSAYEMIYWNVKATGPYGENSSGALFHIDVAAPQSVIAPLPAITDAENFTVNWNGTDDRSGVQWYAVQYREGNRPTSQWQDWLVNTTRTNELFRGKLGETYYFRVRAMDQVSNWESWPTGDGDAFVKIDPSAFPPPPYWNSAYANRRALTILNNDSDPIPVHYPIALHFDGTTSPTAAEIYNASLAATKCDDLRIVRNHQTELDRFVQYCSSSRVDLVFPAQSVLGGGQTSSGEYHLYYGNAAASSPPANLNNIFVPEADTNTMGLWHFQEGTGSTVYDSSGRGHHGTLTNANWADGYMGWAGRFNGLGSNGLVNIAHSSDFNTTATTVEAWFYWTGGGGWPPIVTKKYDGVSGGFEFRLTGDNHIRFLFNGGSWMHSSLGVQPNQWYHVAGVYNGYDRMYIYINGVEAGNAAAQPPSFGTAPVTIGYAQDGSGPNTFPGLIQHVRISNVARYDFPYARVGTPPTVVAGTIQTPPSVGAPDLSILDVATYPNVGSGLLVMATIRNMGTAGTRNTFATDLYLDHVPTNVGDYTGSIRFWVNDPIAAGSTVTLTTVITDLVDLSGWAARPLAPLSESTGTLYAQVDSTGAVSETNNVNNIYSTGAEICVAAADMYENDDSVAMAAPAVLGQTRQHNFDGPTDRDWVSFIAQGGMTYTLRTLNLGPTADTYLYLYDANGTTLLASNDDAGGSLASQIDWTAPTTGTYYALVQHWNPNIGGCGTTYELNVMRALTNKVYLPLLRR